MSDPLFPTSEVPSLILQVTGLKRTTQIALSPNLPSAHFICYPVGGKEVGPNTSGLHGTFEGLMSLIQIATYHLLPPGRRFDILKVVMIFSHALHHSGEKEPYVLTLSKGPQKLCCCLLILP